MNWYLEKKKTEYDDRLFERHYIAEDGEDYINFGIDGCFFEEVIGKCTLDELTGFIAQYNVIIPKELKDVKTIILEVDNKYIPTRGILILEKDKYYTTTYSKVLDALIKFKTNYLEI